MPFYPHAGPRQAGNLRTRRTTLIANIANIVCPQAERAPADPPPVGPWAAFVAICGRSDAAPARATGGIPDDEEGDSGRPNAEWPPGTLAKAHPELWGAARRTCSGETQKTCMPTEICSQGRPCPSKLPPDPTPPAAGTLSEAAEYISRQRKSELPAT